MKKYKTVALEESQYLIVTKLGIVEVFCHGYENKKRNRELDGWYYKSELTRYTNKMNAN